MSKVIYTQTEQTAPTRIVHRMIQYQQQDHTGKLFNIVRLVLTNGDTKFVKEELDLPEGEKEVVFNLKSAKGHIWYLRSGTMRVKPCDNPDCYICPIYSVVTLIPKKLYN